MKSVSQIPLRYSVPLVIIVVAIVLIGFQYFISKPLVLKQIEDKENADIQALLNRVQGRLETMLRYNDIDLVKGVIASFGVERGHELMFLTDAQGNIIASTKLEQLNKHWTKLNDYLDSNLIQQALDMRGTVIQLSKDKQRIISYLSICQGKNIQDISSKDCGYLYYRKNIKYQKDMALVNLDKQVMRESFGIFIAAILVWLFVYFRLTRRVEQLVTTGKKFTQGDRLARAHITGNDELTHLGNTFDSMLNKIVENENILSRSRERMSAIIETAAEAIITIDQVGIIELFNPAAEKIFGYTSHEVIGKNISMLMPEPYQHEHDSYIQNYITTNNAKIIGIGRELLGKRKDNTVFPIWLSVTQYYQDEQLFFAGFIQDITAFKQEQEKARLREEEFKIIFENAPTGVALMDTEGNYLNVNPSLCDILGYSKPELLKLSYKDITHPDDIELSTKYLHKLLRGDFAGFSLDKRYVRKDRTIANVVLNVALVNESVASAHDIEGNPVLLISHVLDFTDKIAAEEQAKIHQEQLAHMDRISIMGELAAGIAHEINQPLTAIDSYAQAAKRRTQADNVDVNKLLELLEKISNTSTRAGDVITRLRAMVKHQTMQKNSVDVNALITGAVKFLEADARAYQFEIHMELDEKIPNIMADSIQIQQVILNLIRNAMDAAIDEAKQYQKIIIRSSLLAEKNRIMVSVIDYGKGIGEQCAGKLFDPFYTTKKSGMGMGLAICQSIIKLHGGRLWFTANKEKGTSFHFTLPTVLEEKSV
jgi:two-component system sensor kinase FixL